MTELNLSQTILALESVLLTKNIFMKRIIIVLEFIPYATNFVIMILLSLIVARHIVFIYFRNEPVIFQATYDSPKNLSLSHGLEHCVAPLFYFLCQASQLFFIKVCRTITAESLYT